MADESKEIGFDVSLRFIPMEGRGLRPRAPWVSGERPGLEFGLSSGEDRGNPLITLWVERQGAVVYYVADVAALLREAVKKVEAF